LRLISGAIFYGLDLFKAQELISLADNFLKLLTIVHKLRSKKPTHANSSAPKYHQLKDFCTENPEGTIIFNPILDPIDTLRAHLDDYYLSYI
jgi:hypothetical protein